jgi:cytochrome P450
LQDRPRVDDWATDWDYLSPHYHEHAPRIWEDLRGRHPFAHTDRFQGAWLAMQYDDVSRIAHDPAQFSSREPNLYDEAPERVLEMPPITTDPPHHAGFRRIPPLLRAGGDRAGGDRRHRDRRATGRRW